MKIALIAPAEEGIPPKKYGGIEWIVYYLARGMGAKGHLVDLYASADSEKHSEYNLISIADSNLRSQPFYEDNPRLLESYKILSLSKAAEMIQGKNYDIVHNHASWRFLLFSRLIKQRVLTTHHGPLSMDFQNAIFEEYKDLPYVSISNNQRIDLPDLNYAATIYNGIDLSLFPFEKEGKNNEYLLFFARLSPEKGAIEAAQAALKTNKKLIISAKVGPTDVPYYEKVKSLIDGKDIKFAGEVGRTERASYYQNAKALLAPIQWEEPFGLFFTEAMACGTPVITFARGSAPEIVQDGKTGFLVNPSDNDIRGSWTIQKTGMEGIFEAIERMYSLPDPEYHLMREHARKRVEEQFTAKIMVDKYEDVYKTI